MVFVMPSVQVFHVQQTQEPNIHVGPEIGVASTKAFTGQVTVLTMFALALANAKGSISEDEYNKVIKGLAEMPSVIEEVLKTNDQIADFSTYVYLRP